MNLTKMSIQLGIKILFPHAGFLQAVPSPMGLSL